MQSNIIVYPFGCAGMLDAYFNNAAPPSYFELTLAAYAEEVPWTTPVDLGEISVNGTFARLHVTTPSVNSLYYTHPGSRSDHVLGMTLVDYTTDNAPKFIIDGTLNTVNGYTTIAGWALTEHDGDLTDRDQIILAGRFEQPITLATSYTTLTIDPFDIFMDQKYPRSPVSAYTYNYDEGYAYDVLMYYMMSEYFGYTTQANSPVLEVALTVQKEISSEATELTEFESLDYARQTITANSVTYDSNGVAQIVFDPVVFNVGDVASSADYIGGYCILLKNAETPYSLSDPNTYDNTTGKILYFAPLANATTQPVSPVGYIGNIPEGLQVSVTPTIKISYGTI